MEQPQEGQLVYATGWGRSCEQDGAVCAKQDKHPDKLQVPNRL